MNATEPLSGEVIVSIEGDPGGTLCDPADSSSVSCSFTSGNDGNFTIEFWAVSSYGDTSNKASAAWKVDGGPPSITLNTSGGTAGGGGWYRGGTLDVSVSGSDAVSGIATAEVSVDGGGWSSGAQVGGDGIHSVGARVIDWAGNESTDSVDIRIDGTSPNLEAELNGTKGRDGWYISSVSVLASASDSLSGVAKAEVSNGSGGWQAEPLTISTDGTHKSIIRAEDVAGNDSTGSVEIRIDGTPPSLNPELSGTKGRDGWYVSSVSISASASDNTSGVAKVEVSDGSGGWQADPLVISADGTHNPIIRAEDIAGNQSTDSVEIRIDGTPPSLNPELGGTRGRDDWYISPVNVFATASDNLSGVAKVEVSDGTGGWQSGPIVISADGAHQPRYRAEDNAGNERTSDGPTINIDTHVPESTFINPPEGSETWVTGVIPLIGRSSDITSGLLVAEISFDEGVSWEPLERTGGDWRTTWDSTEISDGTYVVLARASDIAGNLESTARVTLRIDNAAPFVDIPDEWPVSEPGVLIIEESGVGLDKIEVLISSGGDVVFRGLYSAEDIPQAITWDGQMPDGRLASPGAYGVTATAWDLLGNQGADAGNIIVTEAMSDPAPVPLVSNEPAAPENPSDSSSTLTAAEPEAAAPLAQAELVRVHPWIWPAIAWIGLLSAVGFAKVTDPRPKALQALHDDLVMIRKSLSE